MMQHPYKGTDREPLLGLLALLADRPSEEVVEEVLGKAAPLVGASRLALSGGRAPSTPSRNELRLPLAGTEQHLIASFDEPPTMLVIERLGMVASTLSLAL